MTRENAEKADRARLMELGLSEQDTRRAVRLTYERNELLFCEGQPAGHLLLILSGRVNISRSAPNGKTLLIYLCGAGAVLGVAELFLGAAAISNVAATERVVCVGLSLELCRACMDSNPVFLRRTSIHLAEIARSSITNSAVNILNTLQERLCAYINSTKQEDMFSANYTQLAEMLGVSSRHLFRELKKFCDNGWLIKEAHGYRVVNAAALTQNASACYQMY
ncbi:MAG: cyclic nucleotide-binding domain-containing protein [Oscillospiraceae bacterium]|nr:cyclic nucleotide-binding domain-containing protein [Oscillospiraceae bacterium]